MRQQISCEYLLTASLKRNHQISSSMVTFLMRPLLFLAYDENLLKHLQIEVSEIEGLIEISVDSKK